MLFGICAVSVGQHRQPSAPFSISASRIAAYFKFTESVYCCVTLVFFRKKDAERSLLTTKQFLIDFLGFATGFHAQFSFQQTF